MMQSEVNYIENPERAIKLGTPITEEELEEVQSHTDIVD